uniref:Putative ovule protein n=1 Tax=Solanum chacoense TaxID=4108 RepID=A0A0V0HA34_SOLCH
MTFHSSVCKFHREAPRFLLIMPCQHSMILILSLVRTASKFCVATLKQLDPIPFVYKVSLSYPADQPPTHNHSPLFLSRIFAVLQTFSSFSDILVFCRDSYSLFQKHLVLVA